MYIRQKIKFSSGNHVVAVLSSRKLQVSVENRYNSMLNEQIFCKGKTCYFLKCQTMSRLTQDLVLIILRNHNSILSIQEFPLFFHPNWTTDLCSFVMLRLNDTFNFDLFSETWKNVLRVRSPIRITFPSQSFSCSEYISTLT